MGGAESCADRIKSICQVMKALPMDGDAFVVYWNKLLGELQQLSINIGLDEREDEFVEEEHPRDEGGRFTDKPGSGRRVLSEGVVKALKSEPNEAIFFSGCGRRDGGNVTGSAAVANEYARKNKGVTMGILLERNKAEIPEWDFDDADSVRSWEDASKAYAEQASGDVRVIARPPLRKGNIFETVEFPTLKNNKNVTSVTMINPDTNEETVIFRR